MLNPAFQSGDTSETSGMNYLKISYDFFALPHLEKKKLLVL